MGIKRHKPEEIVTKLRQVEVLCGRLCCKFSCGLRFSGRFNAEGIA